LELGISTYSFPWAVGIDGFRPEKQLDVLDLVHLAEKRQVRRVQIGDNFPLHELPVAALLLLKETADRLNIRLEAGTRRLTKDHVLNYLEIATLLGSPFLRVVIDDDGYHPTSNQVIDVINQLTPHFKNAGVMLAIENHDRFPASVLKEIIQSTNVESVGICLDTANSLGANEGIAHVIDLLGPHTLNLHVKDIRITRVPHKMGFHVSGCAAGDGILNIPDIVNRLRGYKRCQSVTLEVWSDPEKSIEKTMAKESLWVDTSINYLKQFIS
jgi:3-oxoisoapionate decarboxylase